jgi:demethylmenaquinone methyltransferase/2-methoxy-6-polyprenyl-1,4-benzoquinol methylase
MPRSALPAVRAAVASQTAYTRDAGAYDTRTGSFQRYRRHLVDLLPLQPGDVVLDVGCGTGLCFGFLQERIGPGGTIIGVDASSDMLAVASERAVAQGWANLMLVESAVEDAEVAGPVDHVLFCAVHDVLQSDEALDNVLRSVRAGGSVAAGGGKWAPPWAVGLNAGILSLHAPFVRDFTGFDRPWVHLGARVTDLRVQEVAMGAGYLAAGQWR